MRAFVALLVVCSVSAQQPANTSTSADAAAAALIVIPPAPSFIGDPCGLPLSWSKIRSTLRNNGQSALAGPSGTDPRVVWASPIAQTNPGSIYSSPTLDVLGTAVYAGTSDNTVVKLRASDGQRLWTFAPNRPGDKSHYVESTPLVLRGRVYVGSDNGRFYCLDAATGNVLWSYTVPGGYPVHSSAVPSADGTLVYFGADGGHLRAFLAVPVPPTPAPQP
jgi:outer membrane protein assembly factor BamB